MSSRNPAGERRARRSTWLSMPRLMRKIRASADQARGRRRRRSRDVVDVLISPIQTQIALSTPVCCCGDLASLVHEAPDDAGADERDRHRQEDQRLGARSRPSPGRRGRRRRGRSPSPARRRRSTHQMLLKIVPRIVDRTAHERTKKPTKIGPNEPGPRSKRWLVRRPATTPASTPTAMRASAIHEQPAGEDVLPVGRSSPSSCW